MADITELQKLVTAFRDARDWKQFHNPKDMAISLVLEATEFLEHYQWKTADEVTEHLKNHKDDVGDELVDVLYWVLLLAHDLEIDLDKQFQKKLEKNEAKYPITAARGNHKKYTEL